MDFSTAKTIWTANAAADDLTETQAARFEQAEEAILSHTPETLDDLRDMLAVVVAQNGDTRSDKLDAEALARMLAFVDTLTPYSPDDRRAAA